MVFLFITLITTSSSLPLLTIYLSNSLTRGFGDLEVECWPLVPLVQGEKKILSKPSFGREVKPFSHVVDLRQVKDP